MLRCAIYTRKSTEEGLEQDFNSLHAQREACEAFIKSQRHEGWRLVRTAFDDGGYSGGSVSRPALQALLEAVERHEVDIIVVYKVDRLTRSLTDFAKIVELLDAHNISFISVTQQFNTTTSMGRLTLNVLLSFAQFEREVTAERIRDKIAASKKKGMWMGGPPPLGYDVEDRKLVINKTEAATARKLFDRYIELGTVRRLKEEADLHGIATKRRIQKNGKVTGGKPFSRGNLYQLLSNPLYIGRIPHKGETYPGQHEAIIDQTTWDKAQCILAGNAVDRSCASNTKAPFLLTGKVFDESGEPFCQSQADKKGKRYRYYISKRLMHEAHKNTDGWRLPADTLESAVINPVQDLLKDQRRLMDLLELKNHSTTDLAKLKVQATSVMTKLANGGPNDRRDLLQTIVERVDLAPKSISFTLSRAGLEHTLEIVGAETSRHERSLVSITVPVRLQRRGVEMKLVIEDPGSKRPTLNLKLCHLIARARLWFDQLASGDAESIRAIAKRDGVCETEITRVLPLAFLAPEIVEKVLDGLQPDGLTAERLKRLFPLPSDWETQTTLLGKLG